MTNLPISEASNQEVIAYYHQLWHVEQSFRMSKSDLKARPIFHHKREAIEAHLTVVMAALALQRDIERVSGTSLKQIVKQLKPIRSGYVSFAGKNYMARARIPQATQILLEKLNIR